jgi:predicted component of type VI protein secretion system
MFRLRIDVGPRAGEILALAPGKTYVVGRAREADFRFPEDATMSRAHAEIVSDPAGGWILRNKSQHGSLVGSLKVDGDQKLRPGDVLTLGGTQVVFELDPAAMPETAETAPPVGIAPLPPPLSPPPPTPGAGEPKTPPPQPRPTAGAMPVPAGAAAAAASTPPAGGKPAAPAKKGGKGPIIAIAVLLLLVCCCSSSAVFYFKWYKPRHAGVVIPEAPPTGEGH